MNIVSNVENIRIDKYLSNKTDISRENITKMIEEGFITLNEKKVKPSYKVKLGDEISIKDGFIKECTLEATPMDLDIVYEDEYLMIINKPSGLVVHPGAGNYTNTLVNGLLNYTQSLGGKVSFRPGIVHRLDKDTSGLMVVSKDDKCHEALTEMFKNKEVKREYIALLDGVFPQEKAVIDAPIGRSKSRFDKMDIIAGGKKAITHVEVIKKYKENTLVKVSLETGRTHQIRVHLAYIGYPVHNDPVYGNKNATSFGQYLHSYHIHFVHPITNKVLDFQRNVPSEFQDTLDELDEK